MAKEQPKLPAPDPPSKVFVHLQPRVCSNCPKQIPLDHKALYLDSRVYTENGWMPFIEPGEVQHWYWIFCSLECLISFSTRTKNKGDSMGLK